MTIATSKIRTRKQPSASASDRQRRYRAAKKLISIDVSAEVREALQIVRERLQQPTDVVLKDALALLNTHLDHAGKSVSRRKSGTQIIDVVATSSCQPGRLPGTKNAACASPGDAAFEPSGHAGQSPRPPADHRRTRVSGSVEQPDLFDDGVLDSGSDKPRRR